MLRAVKVQTFDYRERLNGGLFILFLCHRTEQFGLSVQEGLDGLI